MSMTMSMTLAKVIDRKIKISNKFIVDRRGTI